MYQKKRRQHAISIQIVPSNSVIMHVITITFATRGACCHNTEVGPGKLVVCKLVLDDRCCTTSFVYQQLQYLDQNLHFLRIHRSSRIELVESTYNVAFSISIIVCNVNLIFASAVRFLETKIEHTSLLARLAL